MNLVLLLFFLSFSLLAKFEHPVDVKAIADLPLKYDIYMDCTSCHSEHEGGKAHLRLDHQKLCLTCHTEHIDKKMQGHKKEKCLNCHDMHKSYSNLLIKPLDKQCISCHKKKSREHTTKNTIIKTNRAKGIHFLNEKISCNTCHGVHGNGKRLLVSPQKVKVFCSSCHDKKAEKLYEHFHKILKN